MWCLETKQLPRMQPSELRRKGNRKKQFLPSIKFQFVSSWGMATKSKQNPAAVALGRLGRIEGRAGADGQHDAGATQDCRPQGGASAMVKKV